MSLAVQLFRSSERGSSARDETSFTSRFYDYDAPLHTPCTRAQSRLAIDLKLPLVRSRRSNYVHPRILGGR